MLDVFKKLFGGKHERDVKAILPIAEQINEHVKQLEGISDEELRGKTEEFRGRVREGLKGVEEPLTVLNGRNVRKFWKKSLNWRVSVTISPGRFWMNSSRRRSLS